MSPPPLPPPPHVEPPQVRLESLERAAKVVAVIVGSVIALGGPAAAAYYGVTSQVGRTHETAESAKAEAKAASASVSQLREAQDRQRKEDQAALDKRLSEMASASAQDRERIIRMEEQLKSLGSQMQTVGGDIRVLLDRLNATPRQRRDYPQ
ncbi:hypothetical protein [Myxococcus landrumensis]|uniref:Uncharacterized protein n=1 Tax=Myxococcus landrumensis TaxID=2813577 RepID=A0ABX7N905_9BACT|nr:hypothetical protein [Myxococcus landrumus]QSQ14029.1 hypothetical protein JY572_37905 [Myxococcus landrumus]